MIARKDIRIVILGDSIVSAAGDSRGMGWVGRVTAKTPGNNPRIDIWALPFPGENSHTLGERFKLEALPRFSAETDNRLVIALSNSDPAVGITTSRSRLNLATVLDECRRQKIETFVVGPTPHHNPELNPEVEHLSTGYEDVCGRRGITFVDCYHPLVDHEGWNLEIQASQHAYPGQVGYGLIAWLVLNRGWYDWLNVSPEES